MRQMTRDQERAREAWLHASPSEDDIERIAVARQDEIDIDGQLLHALFGALGVALLVSAVIAMIPG